MSLFSYLALPVNERVKIERQHRASQKVDQLGAEIMAECRSHAKVDRDKKVEV